MRFIVTIGIQEADLAENQRVYYFDAASQQAAQEDALGRLAVANALFLQWGVPVAGRLIAVHQEEFVEGVLL